MEKTTILYYDFNELKKELANCRKWLLKEVCKNLLNGAPVFVVACNYYTEKTLCDFAGEIIGAKVIYKYIYDDYIYFDSASYSKGINEERRKDRSITKFIIYQTPETQEELKRIREERQRSKTPFDDKYYKKPYSYYPSSYYKVDKSGFTSYYQIEELKRKAAVLRKQRQQEQYKAMDTGAHVCELSKMVETVQSFVFTPSKYNTQLCKECSEFIDKAQDFIRADKAKALTSADLFFKTFDTLQKFYNDIIDARSEKTLYYYRYIWKFDKPNKRPDRTTAHEFRRYCELYGEDKKTVATSKNRRVKLITIKA